jgi:hypothetical protein
MDNLQPHKDANVRELIEAAGAELRFLPAYSPDLNPIEQAFSKQGAFAQGPGAIGRRALCRRTASCLISFNLAHARTSSKIQATPEPDPIPF